MEHLIEKEKGLIFAPIEALIHELLLNDFKNDRNQSIHSIEKISVLDIECDANASEFKKVILIDRVHSHSRVFFDMGHGNRGKGDLDLSFNRQIKMVYNFDGDEYQIENIDELSLFDRTRY